MKNHCQFAPMILEIVFFTCPYVFIDRIFEDGIGINDYHSADKTSCLVREKFVNQQCSDIINKEKFKMEFENNCVGHSDCMIKIREDKKLIPDLFPGATNPYESLEKCIDARSDMFVQFACSEKLE